MAEVTDQKVLLFISHQPDNLKVATSFLKKRNFVVHVETEVKDAIVEVFELKPDFVFISWDHPDKKIQMLPKILAQSSTSVIVPFINKNTKDAIFKIEQCPFTPKLYPPLSGPSVERLILKSSKEDADYLEKVKKFKNAESLAESARIQKNLDETEAAEAAEAAMAAVNAAAAAASASAKPDDVPPPPADSAVSPESPGPVLSEAQIQNNLEHRNEVLEAEKAPLTEEQKLSLQKTLVEDIKPSLENVLTATEEAEAGVAAVKKQQRKGALIFKSETPSGRIKSNIFISKGTPVQKKPALKATAIEGEPEEKTIADGQTPAMNQFVHCISIVCPSWCGYFMIASETSLDFPTIELVFADWLKTQMKSLDDITERDYFNFDDVSDETITEIKRMADYSEVIKAHGQEFSIFFFAVEPKDMKIDFSPDHNYIEVYTRDIPSQAALSFDLLLHLPENQKYLLFTLKDMVLTEDQRNRLLSRNVTKLFTKLENEYEYRRFLVMKTFSRLFEVISSRLVGQ